MRVLFDSTPLQDRRGIGRWAHGTLTALQSVCDVVEMPPTTLNPIEAEAVDRQRSHQWRRAMRREDVAFFPSVHWAPNPLPTRSVVGVLDVLPLVLDHPWKQGRELWLRRWSDMAKQASAIVTLSESSKADICRFLGISSNTVHVVPMGVEQLPDGPAPFFSPGPYVVAIGTDWQKNLGVLIAALPRGVRLYIVGPYPAQPVSISWPQSCDWPDVVWLGRVSDESLGPLLRGASALTWPSLYEGLGLPPLEAMLAGVPVISSDRPAMNEVLRGYARFVPHDDPQAWGVAIKEAVERPIDLRAMAEHGRLMVQERYTWENCGDELVRVFSEVSGRRLSRA